MTSVLVIDDDALLLRALQINLKAREYLVSTASDGASGLAVMARERPDVVIVDLGLPDMDGTEVIRGIRGWSSAPIMVLSARGQEGQKVEALDAGADDYVTKPFSIEELLARLRAATRRAAAPEAPDVVSVGTSAVDLGAKTVTDSAGKPIHLTPTEWHLLEALVRRPGKLVTGRALLTELRGSPDHTDPSYLRIYIAALRRKLEPDPSRPRHLVTEPGMGYRFQP